MVIWRTAETTEILRSAQNDRLLQVGLPGAVWTQQGATS